jgi:hypothetical protein
VWGWWGLKNIFKIKTSMDRDLVISSWENVFSPWKFGSFFVVVILIGRKNELNRA